MSSASSDRHSVHRERLVQAVLALYDNTLAREQSPCDTSQPAPHGALASPAEPEELWDQKVTFRDPLMKVVGIQHYRAQFAALHAFFPTIRLQVYSVTWGHGLGKLSQGADLEPPASKCPDTTAPEVLTIDAVCTYEKNAWIKVRVRQISIIRLSTPGSGGSGDANALPKIVAHEDVWSWRDVLTSIPIVGSVYDFVQPRLGAFFSRQILSRFAKQAGVATAQGPGSLSTNTLHAAYHPIEAQQVGSKPLMTATGQQRKDKRGADGEDAKDL